MASTRLQRNPSSAGTTEKGTLSVWVKRSSLNTNQNILTFVQGGSYLEIYFRENADTIRIYATSHSATELYTNRKFRDTNGWYHIVVAIDSTQATASNRVKLYINGVQETSFSTANYPGQGNNMYINGGSGSINIGSLNPSGSQYFDGSMSHFHWIDGTAYDASAFGETDSTTGEWKIKTDVSVTYGTNGFFILKDGNSVTDQSGNSNNFTVGGGTLTKTEDCPSSVFATANPLQQNSTILTFTNGNNTVAEPSGNSASWTTRWGMSTLAFSSGKFYAEAKISDIGSQQLYPIGIVRDEDIPGITSSVGTNGYGLYINDGRIIGFGNDIQTGLGSFSTNDIIGLAVDADNRTFQYYKNGSTLGSQVTNITAGTYFFTSSAYANHGIQFNFGNGYFGTTAVASAGTNASGNGIFEYNCPAGYTALSTKGLNL
nr:lectin-like protein [uncultured Mediterranean phage uvMED]